jgi:hypothetical protein
MIAVSVWRSQLAVTIPGVALELSFLARHARITQCAPPAALAACALNPR